METRLRAWPWAAAELRTQVYIAERIGILNKSKVDPYSQTYENSPPCSKGWSNP